MTRPDRLTISIDAALKKAAKRRAAALHTTIAPYLAGLVRADLEAAGIDPPAPPPPKKNGPAAASG